MTGIRTRSLAVAAAVVFSISGCDLDGEPRELPTPEFDAYRVFEESVDDDRDRREAAGSEGGFEERLDRMMEGEDEPEEPTLRSQRTIALGGGLVTEIPERLDVWRWSFRRGTALVSFTPPGEHPAMVLITTQYGAQTATGYTRGLRAFLRDVDPSLVGGFGGGTPGADLSQIDGDGEGEELEEALQGFGDVGGLTGGRGIGYRSAEGTFSGWRWYGENPREVTVRLARSEGQWSAQREGAGLDEQRIRQMLTEAGLEDDDRISEALEQLRGVSSEEPTAQRQSEAETDRRRVALPTRPAHMYVGQFETEPTRGIYVAILCAAEPDCAAAGELARMLDEVRPGQAPRDAGAVDFDEHARSLGLVIEP